MNRTRLLASLLLSVALLSGIPSSATAPTASASGVSKIMAILKTRLPGLQIEQVNPATHLPGLYEVVTATNIVYTDARADFMIGGAIMDTRTHENVTAKRWQSLRAIDFNALPLELAIKTVKGNGSRRMAVFSDPDCPYCRQLEQELQGITDITIYTFLFPLESVHPEARKKAVDIWCAKDRSLSWSEWTLKGVQPQEKAQEKSCSADSVARSLKLGEELKVNSTPTLFLSDGRRLEGSPGREQLEQLLAGLQPKKY